MVEDPDDLLRGNTATGRNKPKPLYRYVVCSNVMIFNMIAGGVSVIGCINVASKDRTGACRTHASALKGGIDCRLP